MNKYILISIDEDGAEELVRICEAPNLYKAIKTFALHPYCWPYDFIEPNEIEFTYEEAYEMVLEFYTSPNASKTGNEIITGIQCIIIEIDPERNVTFYPPQYEMEVVNAQIQG